jgi:hypothetical protein
MTDYTKLPKLVLTDFKTMNADDLFRHHLAYVNAVAKLQNTLSLRDNGADVINALQKELAAANVQCDSALKKVEKLARRVERQNNVLARAAERLIDLGALDAVPVKGGE